MKKFLKKTIPILLGMMMLINPISSYAKDNRDAGVMNKEDSVWTSPNSSATYRSHDEGGLTVYIPYKMMMTGQDIVKSMFTQLFDIYSSGYGSNYAAAAAQYNAPGADYINGIKTSYFMKYLSTTDDDTESQIATTDLGDYCPDYNVEFRYAGIVIDSKYTKRGTVVTNPTFASDFIQDEQHAKNDSHKTKYTYTQYNKAGEEYKSFNNLYLLETDDVKSPKDMYERWTGGSGIPDNIPTESPYYDTAQEVFEAWAERTEIGARYKEAYQAQYESTYGMPWWKILQKYARIDGDLDTQSVTITIVYEVRDEIPEAVLKSVPFSFYSGEIDWRLFHILQSIC